ncbi:2'-5' RNA ligase [Halobacteroides halobius DSM 5150]|uniref:2'-5' RNA ligase n=1 Tax=Halobacteroides halobius (strain ATCC 35273 / DSM 5150 / MD-1) TaxID=748449 RepID=L0K9F9_HALHC|nr:2'-5' RNA ligase [Halobacteroides halobius]AGB40994.1 2'-5' RNA ligase [Halobacteroides halobius DSM 5150]
MEADLSNELFIVLTLPQKDLSAALKIQELISKEYNLYPHNNYPELHITLNRINKKEITTGKKILNEIATDINKVNINITNLECLMTKESFIVLEVKETETLTKLANKLHSKLTQAGISSINNYNNWKFHITLISNFLTANPIPQPELKKLCLNLDGLGQPISTSAKAIEIWRPTLDSDKKVITSIKL